MACKSREKQIASAVDAWAAQHRDELVQDLMSLIRIPSANEYRPVIEQFLSLGRRYDFDAEHDGDYSASILWPGADSRRELGMLGHLDVVPAGDGWRYAPYEPIEKNGCVIGRGSLDNKGPVVMALFVMRCMRDLGISLQSGLRLIAGCREETDMQDVIRYLQSHTPPAYTLNLDGAWPVCMGEKGILTAELSQEIMDGNLIALHGGTADNMVPSLACATLNSVDDKALSRAQALCPDAEIQTSADSTTIRLKGLSAHCCAPAQGINAIRRLLDVLCLSGLLTGDAAVKLDRFVQCFPDDYGTGLRIQHEDGASGKTTCVLSLLRYENGRLMLTINVRSAVTQRYDQLLPALQKRLDKLKIELKNVQWSAPRYDSPEQPEVQILLDVCRTYLDKKAKPYISGGGTHSRLFPRSIPFGVGSIDPRRKNPFGGPHSADEAVCIDDLLLGIKIYILALLRLDAYFNA